MKKPVQLEALFPDRTSDEPVGRQLTRRLRLAIESGLFEPSTRLLARRELASRLGLARNTVSAAIEQLIAEGYLESRVGSGTFVVANVQKRDAVAAIPAPAAADVPPGAHRFELVEEVVNGAAMGSGPLHAGIPDVSAFPSASWARITRRKLADLATYLPYSDSQGLPALRVAIAQHVRQFRGVNADPDNIVVVEGTQAAVRLAADVLLAEGDAALIEDPCYQFVRLALHVKNARIVPSRVDREGVDAEHAPAARLAFVSPSHQFPLGVRMTLDRRHALLAWASQHDAYVIEDDYDSEYVFDGKPLPTLHSIDRHGRVIYVGTFSKTLAPALRLGYLVVPHHLTKTFVLARFVSSLSGNQFVEATLADFISEGHFARYVRRMTDRYDERRRAVLELLERSLPPSFSIEGSHGGLHLAVIGPSDFDDAALARRLADRNVCVQPLSSFCIARTECRGFVVGYTAGPLGEVLAATRSLAAAIAASGRR